MSFPLQIADRTVDSPPELAELVRQDADGPGGSVVPDQRPWEWVMGLVGSSRLDHGLALALGAALLREADPATVAEGARLARALHPSPLDELLVHAVDAHDPLVLLQVDPAEPSRSVEDTLLRAVVELADLRPPAVRGRVLEHLRHAGLPGLEIRVLLRHGDVEDLRRWLPAVLEEGLDEEGLALVGERVAQGDDGGRWLAGRHLLD